MNLLFSARRQADRLPVERHLFPSCSLLDLLQVLHRAILYCSFIIWTARLPFSSITSCLRHLPCFIHQNIFFRSYKVIGTTYSAGHFGLAKTVAGGTHCSRTYIPSSRPKRFTFPVVMLHTSPPLALKMTKLPSSHVSPTLDSGRETSAT
jgi:hypothetical protein